MTGIGKNRENILAPEYVSKLKSLELKARAVVEGFMVGMHKSPYHGFSAEFSQHRPYMQGDPIKNIDWKLFAKSERYYIKQFEEETNLISHIIIDVSKSMDYKLKGAVTKFEYSITLAAAFAYIMTNQQDASGLIAYADKIKSYLPPKTGRLHYKNFISFLGSLNPADSTETAMCLNKAVENVKKRGLIIIISDFFDNPAEVIKAIKKYHTKKNEVIVFQILDPIEKNFAFDKDGVFVDLETREEITTFPRQIQKAYQTAFADFLSGIKTECTNSGIEYNLIDTSTPFDKALFAYFKKRYRLH